MEWGMILLQMHLMDGEHVMVGQRLDLDVELIDSIITTFLLTSNAKRKPAHIN